MFIDIFVMWLVLYYAIKIVRSNSRTIQIFKGILLVLIIDGIAKLLGLKTLAYFTDIFMNWGFLAIIIIFQPEIRSLLERLGKSNVFSRITTLTGNEKENLVDQIVKATMLLSQDQTGALISIEQSHSLDDFIATGSRLNSDVTAELLTSIFVTSTPLHDGAVIIQGDKIACASAYFPPTNLDLPSRYGARHRAAIGISEITDAVTIVVSEETGAISITENGKIFQVNRKQLRDYLLRVICGEETEVTAGSRRTADATPAREVVIDDTGELRRRQIEKQKAEAAAKKQDTTVLSILAVKKQAEEEAKPAKIEAEEVVPAEQPETVIADEKTEETHKSGFFGLFGRKNAKSAAKQEETKMEELEDELTDIKLPKKKDRPTPSYPDSAAARRFEHAPAEKPKEQPAAEPIRKAVPVKPAAVRPAAPAAAPAPVAEKLAAAQIDAIREKAKPAVEPAAAAAPAAPEVEPAPRMTPEQVKQERERMMKMYSARNSKEEEEKNGKSGSSSQFDTTKLDVSKLMGFKDDLDQTLEMIDHLDTEDDKPSEQDEEVKRHDGE
jgi:uncharacterized protein (TIGR00159 family)